MFDIINVPLGWIIKVCYQLTNNYLVALLLFAIALQLILSPFAIKQQKNSIKQAKLDPKVKAIRKKYAGRTDQATQQKMNNEVMELYQRENFNPMGGCLPLLIQMPILIALYNVVISPLKYICGFGKEVVKGFQEIVYNVMAAAGTEGAELFASERTVREIDLIRKMREIGLENFTLENGEVLTEEILPDFTVLGLDLSARPADQMWPLIIIPILTLIFTYASQWISKKFAYNANMGQQQDMSMKIMTWSMPLLSVYIAFTVEATIGSYWIFRNILATIQTLILAKAMPIPRFTEEDYKAAERELNVKEPKKKKSGDGTKKVRSLHRIDEDDYEEVKPAENKKPELKESVNKEDAPKLKDESDRHKKDEPIAEDTNGEDCE